jgi:hypothetical protein
VIDPPVTFHARVTARIRGLLPYLCGLGMVAAFFANACEADARPIAVRFPEGVTHGFLLVRSTAGEIIGDGELTQVVKEDGVAESRLVFRFKDGSLHDERVAFSQQRVFTLIRYQLVQRGPSFPEQIDVTVDRATSTYEVRSRMRENGNENILAGDIDLPKDAYNGMIVTTLLNLPKATSESVQVLAFTPKPMAIPLELSFVGEQVIRVGEQSQKAWRYTFKPDIGPIKKFLGKLVGKLPADFHYDCLILADDVPSFVRFEGPLQLMGPILSIELTSPQAAVQPGDQKHVSK